MSNGEKNRLARLAIAALLALTLSGLSDRGAIALLALALVFSSQFRKGDVDNKSMHASWRSPLLALLWSAMLPALTPIRLVRVERTGLPPYEGEAGKIYILEGEGCQALRFGTLLALRRPDNGLSSGTLLITQVGNGWAVGHRHEAGETYPLIGDEATQGAEAKVAEIAHTIPTVSETVVAFQKASSQMPPPKTATGPLGSASRPSIELQKSSKTGPLPTPECANSSEPLAQEPQVVEEVVEPPGPSLPPTAAIGTASLAAEAEREYTSARELPANSSRSSAVKPADQFLEARTPEAMFLRGVAYRDGQGVPQNWDEAAAWFRKAASLGHPKAQFNLGACCERGHGVPQDPAEAVRWYRKAAEQGDREAQCNLGACYGRGNGVQRNYQEAVKWFQKAATQGDPEAQGNLGQMYHHGLGVPKDLGQAGRWYRAAISNGFEPAQTALYQLQQEQEAIIPSTRPGLEKEILRLVSAIDHISGELKTMSPPSSFRDPSNARMAARGIEYLIQERRKRIEKARKCMQQFEINYGRKLLLQFVNQHRMQHALNL